MRRPLVLLALCSIVAHAPAHSQAEDGGGSAERPGRARTYCGDLATGAAVVPVETVLTVRNDGRITGRYKFQDGEAWTSGLLSEKAGKPGATRILFWLDRYGMGTLAITFDARSAGFEGLWGVGDAPPDGLWNGRSCNAPTS